MNTILKEDLSEIIIGDNQNQIKELQNRPLEPIYTLVFMEEIHYKVKEEGQLENKTAYALLGQNLGGFKDILGIWIGESPSPKFWLEVLNSIKNRGIEEVLIFSLDNLRGIKEAIQIIYPEAQIQRPIIHQLRNSFKTISHKYIDQFARDL